MIRILLADDQSLIRSGIRSLLEAEDDIEVVAEAADGRQAVTLAAEHRPDIVLIHDGARPFVSASLIARAVAAAEERLLAALPSPEDRFAHLLGFGTRWKDLSWS